MPKVAVLIPVHGRADGLESLLKEGLSQADSLSFAEKYSFSWFVNLDGTPAGSLRDLPERFPQVHLIHSDGDLFFSGGLLRAWEEALSEGGFDFYLWLRPDVALREWAVYTLLDTSTFLGHKAIVSGTVADASGKAALGGRDRKDRLVFPDGVIPVPCRMFDGALVLVPSAVCSKVGLFDGRYHSSLGDRDYAMRAARAGIQAVVAPKILADLRPPLMEEPHCGAREAFMFNLRHKGLPHAVWNYFRNLLPGLSRETVR